ncbi:PulJ/GspJ family protein [Desulfonema magnum]|uniref:PulJ/GspJ family protein n=1 Tax=Desulfonema magnum TaxID=45655 RepID=UPI0023EE89FB|nr:prepilin-type N-terminal cleavage/methylation domain-containing protein [Desulfonema magnum]
MKTAHDQTRGFTLLELLISLTIISVIVVIISGALRIGVRAWEKGEQDIETRQRYRIVLDLMKRQLTSICLRKMTDKSRQSFFLKGDNKSLGFLSYKHLIPANTFGTVYVRYIVNPGENEGEHLIFYEKNIVLLAKDADMDNLNEDDFHDLIPELHNIEFEYLKKQAEGFEWQPSWEPENDKGIPLAVKIIFKKDALSAPVSVVVRMNQDTDA